MALRVMRKGRTGRQSRPHITELRIAHAAGGAEVLRNVGLCASEPAAVEARSGGNLQRRRGGKHEKLYSLRECNRRTAHRLSAKTGCVCGPGRVGSAGSCRLGGT